MEFLDRANLWCRDGVLPEVAAVRGWEDRLGRERRGGFRVRWAEAQREGWASWVRSYQDAAAMADGCWFDAAAAQYVEDFFGLLTFHQGRHAGEPIQLMGWQRNGLVWPVFGWKREDGLRRIRVVYCEIPKKNGKSAFSSGVGLYMLAADGEPGPEVYAAAVDRKQAGIVYDEAYRMVQGSRFLRGRCDLIRSTKSIVCNTPPGIFRTLSADSESSEGYNQHFCIFDEVHAHKKRSLYDVLRFGGAGRNQPLFWQITTAGEYDEASIGWTEHQAAARIFEDEVEDWSYHALMFCADEKAEDWTDVEVWKRVNPSLGVALQEDEFKEQIALGLRDPSAVNNIKRRRLNMWVQAAEAWLDDMPRWHALRRDFALEDLAGRRCFGGMDLGATQDLTAFTLIFPPLLEEEPYRILCWHWLPKGALIEKARRNQAPYQQWVAQGWIRLTDGDTTDYRRVRSDIEEILGQVECEELNYDPMFANELVGDLEDAGVNLVEFRPTIMQFSPAMKAFHEKYLAGELAHDGNPVFSWELGNLTIRANENGDIRPDKKTNRRKIDGPVSCFMGFGRAVVAAETLGPGVY